MEQAISSDLIRGHIDTIILHTLLDGDKYAQQISDTVSQKSNQQYQINQATLYSSLKRLESCKFVTSYWNDANDGRRKYYKISEEGKQTVEDNLTSWTFSRAIIDKLMNIEPTETVKVESKSEIKEEKPELKNTQQKNHIFYGAPTSHNYVPVQPKPNLQKSESNAEKTVSFTSYANVIKDKDSNKNVVTDVKEINFRNILNGLIKTTNEQNGKNNTEKQNIEEIKQPVTSATEKTEIEIPKFSESINYNSVKPTKEQIDFSELSVTAKQQGYKVSVSSKNSAKPYGVLFINKLRFFTSLVIFTLSIIEYIIVGCALDNLAFSPIALILCLIVMVSPPAIFGIQYLKRQTKTRAKPFGIDKLLTSAIVVFNLILLTFAINFLAGTNFSSIKSVGRCVIIPMIVFVDVFLFFLAEYLLSKLSFFRVKKKSI